MNHDNDMENLAAAWSAAIDDYDTERARRITAELIPLLLKAGSVGPNSAFVCGDWAVWVRSYPGGREVARRHVNAPAA